MARNGHYPHDAADHSPVYFVAPGTLTVLGEAVGQDNRDKLLKGAVQAGQGRSKPACSDTGRSARP